MDVPYIAEKRAPEFAEAGYETPADVANASPAEVVSEVYGVGPTAAERIIEGARDMCFDDGGELSEDERQEAEDAHRRSKTTSTTHPDKVEDRFDQPAERDDHVPVWARNHPPADEDDDEEVEEEVTAEQFQERIVLREGGEEIWYRDPETGDLLIPYEAPGFENWCEERGHDPEEFHNA